MRPLVVTGASGFIGKNLTIRATEMGLPFRTLSHTASAAEMQETLNGAGLVLHLAGVNRPRTDEEFALGNPGITEALCKAMDEVGAPTAVVYASSIQASNDNPYGRSKLAAEDVLREYAARSGISAYLFRLPNVFGKWCRPNYNSAVATFCHNIANDLPITVNDPAAPIRLVYVDDVVETFLSFATPRPNSKAECQVEPVYASTVGEVASLISGFRESRATLLTGEVGQGLKRALYATYLSYLRPHQFDYALPTHPDQRGVFAEFLRTPDCGQFSFFTAHPGITRGGHYHHTKTEKFLVVQGRARFSFRHVLTGEIFELVTSGDEPRVVETVPGWAHDVTNIGGQTMVVMLWANELFDRTRPDTVAAPV